MSCLAKGHYSVVFALLQKCRCKTEVQSKETVRTTKEWPWWGKGDLIIPGYRHNWGMELWSKHLYGKAKHPVLISQATFLIFLVQESKFLQDKYSVISHLFRTHTSPPVAICYLNTISCCNQLHQVEFCMQTPQKDTGNNFSCINFI